MNISGYFEAKEAFGSLFSALLVDDARKLAIDAVTTRPHS